jgi:hypothetical protein
MITHIVFFKLIEPTPENVAAARDKLLSMDGKVPMLRHLEVGIDLVRSERSFDIALYTKLDTIADLKAYQADTYHGGEVAPFMRSISSAVATVDYES